MIKNNETSHLLQRDFNIVHKMGHYECLSLSNYWFFLEEIILKVLGKAAILTFNRVRSVLLSVIRPF